MADQWRAQKTVEKIQRLGLPSAAGHRRKLGNGDGMACNGCLDTIVPQERMHSVRVGTSLNFRFHDACYAAWASYPR
jgi:hypothetical protein